MLSWQLRLTVGGRVVREVTSITGLKEGEVVNIINRSHALISVQVCNLGYIPPVRIRVLFEISK